MNNKVIQDIESPLEQIMRESNTDTKNKLSVSSSSIRARGISSDQLPLHRIEDTEKKLSFTEIKQKAESELVHEKIHKILFNGKTLLLKEKNKRICEASEGAKWSEGVDAGKALEWYERKGATIER